MSLHIKSDGTRTRIQFVLPDDIHDGPISAVGTFNDWVPGAHKLVRRSNGTRSVSVAVPAGQAVKFRYLGAGGVWVDDEDADAITAEGSVIKAWAFGGLCVAGFVDWLGWFRRPGVGIA